MKSLDDLRKGIDEVDIEIIHLLGKRMDLVREIGKLKKENDMAPLDEKRWQEVVKKVSKIAKDHSLSQDLIVKIYEEIHKTALEIEKI